MKRTHNLPSAAMCAAAMLLSLVSLTAAALAEDDTGAKQSLDDAWWTGPVITMSPASMPQWHAYFEPYLFDMKVAGQDRIRSRTYMLYGVTDKLTAGLIPVFGYNDFGSGEHSSGPQVGDLSLLLRYQLTSFDAESFRPATALALEWTLPTGKHDRLERLADGLGDGVSVLTARFLAQEIFHAPNGRLVRARIAISQTIPGTATLHDRSVYGTDEGFAGGAKPGATFAIETGWEYSITRNWVLATDITYSHTKRTHLWGMDGADAVDARSGTADTFAFAPAVEYNWSATRGILAGVRIIPKSHGTPHSVTPVVALSLFF